MKKIAFMSPSTKGGPYYIYQEFVDELNKNHWNKIQAYFFSSKKDWIKLHVAKYDCIFSVIPFLFKPLGTKKYYYNIHWNFEIERKRSSLWNKLLYLARLNIWFCNKIILNSMFLADKLWFLKKYKNKINIIPNPIILENKDLKEKKLQDPNNIKILTVSSTKFLEKWMWIIDLANQIKKIKNIHIHWTIIAGWDKENKQVIQKEFNKIVLPKNIKTTWIDWIEKEELNKHYKANDVFLYGTRLDTRGQTISEAMSYSLPIILLEYELWKYIYPTEFITNNIENKLIEIINNYKKHSELSKSFVNKYDIHKITKKLFNYINTK